MVYDGSYIVFFFVIFCGCSNNMWLFVYGPGFCYNDFVFLSSFGIVKQIKKLLVLFQFYCIITFGCIFCLYSLMMVLDVTGFYLGFAKNYRWI